MADTHDRDHDSHAKAQRLDCSACEVDGQWSARHPQNMARAQHAIAGNESLRLEYEANPQQFMQRFGVAPSPPPPPPQFGITVSPPNILHRAVTAVSQPTLVEHQHPDRTGEIK